MAAAGSWFALVVDQLRQHRAAGRDFDVAWSLAMRMFPPSAKDDGGLGQLRLAVGGDETIVSFFRRACESAYYDTHVGPGNGVALKHFNVDMLQDGHAPMPRHRVAA